MFGLLLPRCPADDVTMQMNEISLLLIPNDDDETAVHWFRAVSRYFDSCILYFSQIDKKSTLEGKVSIILSKPGCLYILKAFKMGARELGTLWYPLFPYRDNWTFSEILNQHEYNSALRILHQMNAKVHSLSQFVIDWLNIISIWIWW